MPNAAWPFFFAADQAIYSLLPMVNAPLRLLALAIVSIAAVYFGFFAVSPEQQELLFRDFGYWNILILFVSLVALFCAGNGKVFLDWIRQRESIALIISCLLAATFLYTREGGSFKIIFDEQLLSNVALNMSNLHEPVVRESSLADVAWYDVIDKRPLLFPLILSLVHNIFGYAPENAFYLNFVLTALFLGLLYCLLKQIANRTAAIYAVAIACFMPLIEQNSSGGGFEMLNLCGILIAAQLAIKYWKKPSATALSQLVLSLALLSHIRYESVLIALPFAVLVAVSWIKEKQITLPLAVILVPFSFLPLAWQFNFIKTQPQYWQYSLKGDSSFDLSYFSTNIKHAANFLFIPSTQYAGSPIIGILGVCSLVALIAFSITRRESIYANRPDRVATCVTAIGLILQTLLVFFFTFGQLDDSIVSRLGLPLVLLLISSGAIVLAVFHKTNKYAKTLSLTVTAAAALFAFKSYSFPEYTNGNAIRKRIEVTLDFADALPQGNYLFVSAMPRALELEGYNNISTATARLRIPNIKQHIELGTYDKVFVVQYGAFFNTEAGPEKRILTATKIGAKAILTPVLEQSLLAKNFLRISEITGFNLDAPDELDDFVTGHEHSFRELSAEEYKDFVDSLP